MTQRHVFRVIDEALARQIEELHKQYPKLGHHGLLAALEDAGVKVHPEDLERFMQQHHIRAQKPWHPYLRLGLPRWMAFGGGAVRTECARKRIRWRLW